MFQTPFQIGALEDLHVFERQTEKENEQGLKLKQKQRLCSALEMLSKVQPMISENSSLTPLTLVLDLIRGFNYKKTSGQIS